MSLSTLSLRWRQTSADRLPGWLSGLREYFAYHGIWAPGVRLLRKLSVRAKVSVVMGILALPLVPLSWHLVAEQQHTVQRSTQRLAGLRLAGATSSMGAAVQAQLLALDAGGDVAANALRDEGTRLAAAAEAALAAGLPLRTEWERQRQAVERAAGAGNVAAGTQREFDQQALKSLDELRQHVVGSANIAATADNLLHDRANLALEELPSLQQALGELHARVLRPVSPGERHDALLRQAAAWGEVQLLAGRATQRLHKLQNAAAGEPLPQLRSYTALLRAQVLATEGATDGSPLAKAYDAARAEVQQQRLALLAEVETTLQRSVAQARELRALLFGALGFALLLALYLLYTFFLVMKGGLVQLNQQMVRMAEGDLSARLSPLGVDEVAATMRAMTTSLVRLSDLLASVRQGVAGVNQAATQVAVGNADLSARDHATSQGLDAVVQGVARYALQLEACGRQVEAVVATVQGLRLESARNRKQMQRLRERMAALRSGSREIADIVTLIDNIAFRTNILALNASVEASKAGESGRGFAVVAQEVRSLALRGAESARRIATIVNRSTDDIDLSRALAEEAGKALAEVDQQVDHIHVAMDDVAALTRSGEKESAAILEQLTQIKDSTAQNLRLVEQLATASDSLRSQGERLAHKVGQFKLS